VHARRRPPQGNTNMLSVAGVMKYYMNILQVASICNYYPPQAWAIGIKTKEVNLSQSIQNTVSSKLQKKIDQQGRRRSEISLV
jgi:hypothetical protein